MHKIIAGGSLPDKEQMGFYKPYQKKIGVPVKYDQVMVFRHGFATDKKNSS